MRRWILSNISTNGYFMLWELLWLLQPIAFKERKELPQQLSVRVRDLVHLLQLTQLVTHEEKSRAQASAPSAASSVVIRVVDL